MGTWLFNRSFIHTQTQQSQGKVTGRAVFSYLNENRLHYKEEGILETPNGQTVEVSQNYEYEYEKNTDSIKAYFAADSKKNLFFHQLSFSAEDETLIEATGTHYCDPDTYEANYKFDADNKKFTLIYFVTGPKKNYISSTIFEREDDSPPQED